jgi:hypothetical protein
MYTFAYKRETLQRTSLCRLEKQQTSKHWITPETSLDTDYEVSLSTFAAGMISDCDEHAS